MTERQQLFVNAYLRDPNATQAAIAAGYSAQTAKQQGSRLLTNVDVQQALATAQQVAAAQSGVAASFVLDALKEVVERTMQRVPVMRFDRESKRMVQETDEDGEGVWQFDARGAVGALTLLGKHLGMFSEKVEHSGTITHKHQVWKLGDREVSF